MSNTGFLEEDLSFFNKKLGELEDSMNEVIILGSNAEILQLKREIDDVRDAIKSCKRKIRSRHLNDWED